MKLFGSLRELVGLVFRKNGQEITVRPNQTTTYTADRDLQLPLGDADTELVGDDSTQTLTNKTIAAGSNTVSGLTHGSEVDNPSSGVHGVTGDVVGTTDTQTLTGKTLTGNEAASLSPDGVETITLPVITDTLVTRTNTETLTNKSLTAPSVTGATNYDEIATPSNPSASEHRLYFKSDGNLYKLNSSGEEVEVGSGSGQGEINYLDNGDAEVNTDGWTTTGSATLTRTTTSGEILRGDASFRLEDGSTGGTIYYDFTLPEADEQKLLKVEADLKALGAYSAGDWTIDIVQDPSGSATVITPSETDMPAGQGKFLVTWVSTDADTYRLRFTNSKGAAISSTDALVLDNIIVGPGQITSGATITAWETFTPTLKTTGGSVTLGGGTTAAEGQWRRVGTDIEVHYMWRFGTSPTVPAGTFLLDETGLPSDITFDTSFNLDDNAPPRIGICSIIEPGADFYSGLVRFTAAGIRLELTSDSANVRSLTDSNLITFTDGDTLVARLTVPVAEWAGQGAINLGAGRVEYAFNSSTSTSNDTTSFAYGPEGKTIEAFAPAGTATVSKRIRFQSPIQETDQVSLQIKPDGDDFWTEVGNTFMDNQSNDAGTTVYGVRLAQVAGNNTDVDVVFNSAANVSNAWSTLSAYRWRAVKHSAGVPVGFGIARGGEAGLIPYYQEETLTGNLDSSEGTYDFSVVRVGSMVTVHGSVTTASGVGSAVLASAVVPSWARPLNGTVYNQIDIDRQDSSEAIVAEVQTDGDVQLTTKTETFGDGTLPDSTQIFFSLNYTVLQ